MAGGNVNALVGQWNTNASLNLAGEQEQQVCTCDEEKLKYLSGFCVFSLLLY
jgi:hypothetical protein